MTLGDYLTQNLPSSYRNSSMTTLDDKSALINDSYTLGNEYRSRSKVVPNASLMGSNRPDL
jgi:hypothetical protein